MNIIEKYKYKKWMETDDEILDDELIEIVKRDLKDETLECFRFSDSDEIHKVILSHYRNVNQSTLIFATCKIMLMHFLDDFDNYREHENKVDFKEAIAGIGQEKEG